MRLNLPDKCEEDVFGTDEVSTSAQCLLERLRESVLRSPGERNVLGRWLIASSKQDLGLPQYILVRDAERLEGAAGLPGVINVGNECQEDVLVADAVVAELACLILSERDRSVKRSNIVNLSVESLGEARDEPHIKRHNL